MLYLAIDQHRKHLTISVRDEAGDVVHHQQVSTRWQPVRRFFAEFQAMTRDHGGYAVIVEVCGFNDWLIRLLAEYGCREIVLVQPGERLKHKTDRRDASRLSELLWLNRTRLLAALRATGVIQSVGPLVPPEVFEIIVRSHFKPSEVFQVDPRSPLVSPEVSEVGQLSPLVSPEVSEVGQLSPLVSPEVSEVGQLSPLVSPEVSEVGQLSPLVSPEVSEVGQLSPLVSPEVSEVGQLSQFVSPEVSEVSKSSTLV